jgi:colanic acid/amylovoran biosynthesis glycosyltransferase
MKRIAYLLHRFPGITDTFIRREIRSLQAAGTDVRVISVWKPDERATTPEILSQWTADTHFALPSSALAILRSVLVAVWVSPGKFFATLQLALSTSRPGIRGLTYQLIYFLQAILVAEELRRSAANHIHNHIGDQSGTVTMLAANLAGIGYSITFHGWPVFFDAKYSRIKEKVLGARFTRSISYFCRSQLMMFSECDDPTPFKVIHCGLNIGKYTFRLPREKIKRLFCAARLSPEKGLTFAIEALRLLLDKGFDLELVLAGDGPSKAHLQALTHRLGLSDRVKFVGFLTEDEVINELQVSDLFVLPSFVEGVPVSAMEAMAIGVPVIATNIAGTSELIEDRKTGLLVRPSDAEALADAVVTMIGDHGFRLRAAAFGRKIIEEEFDVDKESAKLNLALHQCCDYPGKRPEVPNVARKEQALIGDQDDASK